MKISTLLFRCLVLLLLPAVLEARPANLIGLNFPADENNLQVLPQRFEYSLLDEERLQIGDVLIDVNQVTFQLDNNPEGQPTLRFSWPAGLLKKGQLILKSNSDKALFSAELTSQNVKISHNNGGPEDIRSDMAEFSTTISKSTLEDMKYLPFMTFCIFREEKETRIYFCSKELYLSSQDGKPLVKSRVSTRKASYIEINGKVVGPQGIIYLNDSKETVTFKAQIQSGVSLEIETRKKDVSFKDVVMDAKKETILLTASGAEPVNESRVKKISAEEWQIEIPTSRPVIYLKGEGDIPMRQEFYIRGALPSEKDRPFLSGKTESKVYTSTLRVQGVTLPHIKLSPRGTNSTLQSLPKNQFIWTLLDFQRGEENRRDLRVDNGESKFVASFEVFRGSPFEAYIGGRYLSPSATSFVDVSFHWWMRSWGLGLNHAQHLATKEDELNFTTLELLWRAQPGFNLEDATWGLSLPVQMIQTSGSNLTALGLGAFWQHPSAGFLEFSDWTLIKLQYFGFSTGDTVKLNSGLDLHLQLLNKLSPTLSWRYGLASSFYKFEVGKAEQQIGVETGLSWRF